MEFFPEIMLSEEEGELIARGMLAVARADGQLHDREIALVQGFFGDVAQATPAAMAAVEREDDIAPDVLAAGLGRDEVAMLFIKTCILLAYADGTYHDDERSKIDEYAAALDIGEEARAELEQSVKEFLLGQLVDRADHEAALFVARERNLID